MTASRAPPGTSKWRYWKLWNLALEGITGFSVAPLKVATYVGFATALSAFVFAAFMLVKTPRRSAIPCRAFRR